MKNKSALYLLLAANAVSGFAQGISMLAIPWYFSDVLQNNSAFGLIYGISTFLTLFWGLYVGVLVDKYSRKSLFLITNLVGFTLVGSIALYGFYLGNLPMPMVGLTFAITMFAYNIHYPTLYAFGQEISEKKDYGKMNSLIEIQGQTISMFSGAIAALLITGVNPSFLSGLGIAHLPFDIKAWKLHEIFLLDAFTYLIAFTFILFIRYVPLHKPIETGGMFERLKDGFIFLKAHRILFIFGIVSSAIFVVLLTHIHQLMPIYVSKYLATNSAVYAISEMTYAIGALLAGIGIRWIFKHTNTIKAIIILMLTTVLVFGLTTFTKNVFCLMFMCFVLGITNAGTRVLRITYLFHRIPNHIIGRTGSVFRTSMVLGRVGLISIFSLTFFSQNDNIKWAYFICGCVVFIAAIPLILNYFELVNSNKKNE